MVTVSHVIRSKPTKVSAETGGIGRRLELTTVTERATAEPPAPVESAAWLDEGAVAADWAPPPGEPDIRRRIPGWLFWTAGLLVLVLLGVAVWGFGGFRKRTDLQRPTAPGTLVRTGLYELTFTEVTAQRNLDEQGAIEDWKVIVIGSGRTTGDESSAPTYYGNDSMFAAKDEASGEIQTPASAAFGVPGDSDKVAFTPGLPPVRYALTLTFSPAYRPQPTLKLLVSELEYSTGYLASDEKNWLIGTYGFLYELPVRELPPTEY